MNNIKILNTASEPLRMLYQIEDNEDIWFIQIDTDDVDNITCIGIAIKRYLGYRLKTKPKCKLQQQWGKYKILLLITDKNKIEEFIERYDEPEYGLMDFDAMIKNIAKDTYRILEEFNIKWEKTTTINLQIKIKTV